MAKMVLFPRLGRLDRKERGEQEKQESVRNRRYSGCLSVGSGT